MYGEAIIDRLHPNSALRDKDNSARKVFINTVGALLDDLDLYGSMEAPYLQNATGVYLDLHGKDLGVKRKHLESDDDYRLRLVYESLGYLTVSYLRNMYDLPLYVFIGDFNVSLNTLTSDNPFITGEGFMSIGSEDIQRTLNSKFILDGGLVWIDTTGSIQFIISEGVNVINEHLVIYQNNYLGQYFKDNTDISSVYLVLPNANNCYNMFRDCTGLTDVDLDLLSVTDCQYMFSGCTGLTGVKLNAPKLSGYSYMFYDCSALETIDVTIPTSIVNAFKSYVLGLELENLTSFKINGEEVEL